MAGLVRKFLRSGGFHAGRDPVIADSRIGVSSIEAALETLDASHIRVAHQEVGGTRGRRIRFNTQTGEIECRFAGDIPGGRGER